VIVDCPFNVVEALPLSKNRSSAELVYLWTISRLSQLFNPIRSRRVYPYPFSIANSTWVLRFLGGIDILCLRTIILKYHLEGYYDDKSSVF